MMPSKSSSIILDPHFSPEKTVMEAGQKLTHKLTPRVVFESDLTIHVNHDLGSPV